MKRPPYKEGEEVMLLVEAFTDLGVKVIIDGRYEGLLYKSDVFRELDSRRAAGRLYKKDKGR